MKSGLRSGYSPRQPCARVGVGALAHHAVAAQHAQLLVDVVVVGAHHAALDGAHVVRVIEAEVRHPAEAAEALAVVGRAVRLAHVLDQRDAALLRPASSSSVEAVEALHVGQEDGARLVGHLGEDLLRVHRQRARIDVGEDRREAVLQHRRDVGNPGQRRHDHLAALGMADLQHRHREQVGRGAGVDEDAVLHAQPLRPLGLERGALRAVGEDRVVALQVADHRVEVFAQDVAAHQGELGHGVVAVKLYFSP